MTELVQIFMEQRKLQLCNPKKQQVCNGVYVSLISDLTLSEYIEARSAYCVRFHGSPCIKCERLLQVASVILRRSYCSLSEAFRISSPGAKYTVERARSSLLQLPLVCIRIGNAAQGRSFCFLMEKFSDTNYGMLREGLSSPLQKGATMEKTMVKMLLNIAKTDRERECVRYAIYKASGMTPTQARRLYGFERMEERALSVEATIEEVQQIRIAIEDLACTEERALLTSMGVYTLESNTSSSESEEEEAISEQALHYMGWSDTDAQAWDSHAHPHGNPTPVSGLRPHADDSRAHTDGALFSPSQSLGLRAHKDGALSSPAQALGSNVHTDGALSSTLTLGSNAHTDSAQSSPSQALDLRAHTDGALSSPAHALGSTAHTDGALSTPAQALGLCARTDGALSTPAQALGLRARTDGALPPPAQALGSTAHTDGALSTPAQALGLRARTDGALSTPAQALGSTAHTDGSLSSPTQAFGCNAHTDGALSTPAQALGLRARTDGALSSPAQALGLRARTDGALSSPAQALGLRARTDGALSPPVQALGSTAHTDGSLSSPTQALGCNAHTDGALSTPAQALGLHAHKDGALSSPAQALGLHARTDGTLSSPAQALGLHAHTDSALSSPSQALGLRARTDGALSSPAQALGLRARMDGALSSTAQALGSTAHTDGSLSSPTQALGCNAHTDGALSTPAQALGLRARTDGALSSPAQALGLHAHKDGALSTPAQALGLRVHTDGALSSPAQALGLHAHTDSALSSPSQALGLRARTDGALSSPAQALGLRARTDGALSSPAQALGLRARTDGALSSPAQALGLRARTDGALSPPAQALGSTAHTDGSLSSPTQALGCNAHTDGALSSPSQALGLHAHKDGALSSPAQALGLRARTGGALSSPAQALGLRARMDGALSSPAQALGSNAHADGALSSPAQALGLCTRTDGALSSPAQSLGSNAHPDDVLRELLHLSKYNWFDFMEQLGCQRSSEEETIFADVLKLGLPANALCAVQQSYFASLEVEKEHYEQDHTARALNGEIVSELDSDDPDLYFRVKDPLSAAGKDLVVKKRAAIHRRARRQQAKAIAERRFLSRKVSKRLSQVLKQCPCIGKEIESFVQSHNVGADAWRRTGVLTFDGNTHIKEKVTYEKIRQHLEEVYERKFSYGTVIQLCVPRNKRRRSAKNYCGVAKVTSRRARKGFTLRFNPDAHWSAAFYKALNKLQYIDGRDMLNINRDDATGFRLDTLTTCKQYKTPVVEGHEVLTTRTDYVNKYPSILQTTSYNFSATATTEEVCVGVIKAHKIQQKNPAQHASDLEMLELKEELSPVFVNNITGHLKSIECVRVDGAVDEGPSHEECNFFGQHATLLKAGKQLWSLLEVVALHISTELSSKMDA